MRHHRLRLIVPDAIEEIVTPMLFVGNNHYTLQPGRVGQRDALDDGKLSIFAVASRHRMALIGFALRTLMGRADPDRDFAAIGDAVELTDRGALVKSIRCWLSMAKSIRFAVAVADREVDAGALRVDRAA